MATSPEFVERLAVEQALYNAIGRDVKTNVDGNLRAQVNEHFRDLYEMTGATGFEVRVNGRKVGTFGFNRVKGTPAKTVHEFVLLDHARCVAVMDEDPDFGAFAHRYVEHHLEEVARAYFEQTGTVPDGCDVLTHEVPATPDGIRPNGTLRVSPEKVADALGPRLPQAIAGLLEGGE